MNDRRLRRQRSGVWLPVVANVHVGRNRHLRTGIERVPKGDCLPNVGEGRKDSSVDAARCTSPPFVTHPHGDRRNRWTELAQLDAQGSM
jgi:hypothetical protein